MKNVAKNFFYQSIFQVAKIIMPIITIPIVSKALGPSGIGVYNYTFSIAQYFVLVAGLGVTIYGNREIALAWHKKRKNVSNVFWEIVVFKGITTILVMGGYLLLLIFLDQKIYLFAQSLTILSVLVDISWFFMGIEDFKKTSMCNLFVQVLVFICILLFVKSESDTLKYTLIQAGGLFLSQLLVWLFAFKYIRFVRVRLRDCIIHFKGAIEYFIPQVAIMLYTNLNKTILGIFLGNVFVGYFSNSLQLNTVFITIITTLDLVLLPHMTGYFANNNIGKIVETMRKTIHLQLFFSIAIMFGMLTVFDKLVPWFFGNKFLYINNIVPYFSVLIVVIPLGMSISRQYLMPIGKIREYNKSVIIGAGINVFANVVLLPTIGFFGVVFSNILAEFFVMFVRTRSFLNNTDFKFDMKKIISYIFSGVIMCFFTRVLTNNMAPSLITNIVQLVIAVPIYLLTTTVMKTSPLNDLLNSLKK